MVSSGSVYSDVKQTTVRLNAQYLSAEEIGTIQIKAANGLYIELQDVATVQARDKRAVTYSRVDGNDAVAIEVYKASGANIVDAADSVLLQLEKLKIEYPDYIFTVVYDQSRFCQKFVEEYFLYSDGRIIYYRFGIIFVPSWLEIFCCCYDSNSCFSDRYFFSDVLVWLYF